MKVLIAFFLCFVVSNTQASNDKTFFWKIEHATDHKTHSQQHKATVYLLGSIHVADASFYPLRKKIEAMYEASEYLVVELDTLKTDAKTYARLITDRGMYKGDESISDHLSAETLTSLKTQLRILGIPMSKVEKYKPGIMVMTITMLQMSKMGYTPELGIDVHFLNKKNKTVIELESLEQQINLLLDMTEGDLLLQDALSSMAKSEIFIQQLMSLWKQGDEIAMEQLLITDTLKENPSFSTIYETLFFERNVTMSNRIRQFLKTEHTYFVVVGAGHLIGDRGIVNLLKQQGYTVERL